MKDDVRVKWHGWRSWVGKLARRCTGLRTPATPNKALHLTAYSVRYAPAFGSR